jgi:predicted DCC family thiol-disulfide oxidoreductase YuxK
MNDKIEVYYNSACPVCKAGIADQQCRMAAQGADGVAWLDVHADPKLVNEVGAELETVRERLHVKTADGVVHVGADAFAVLFAQTKGQKWLGRLLSLPLLRSIGKVFYNVFARGLYRWNRAKGRW